ncbi:dipeptide epimerase [Lentilactobacillus farraginis]|uniref:Dipeptide epimerase n=1 Tax=Lentilactobacillus farraginis DSM 18382 = JCM 14108 TaxID=1423743 RepID=X0P928_9LACO|nr:dipeptide epimerase [Lentilactobacillus farraginis]KRM10137.1 muconate cycloisomerase [Lentilactobacillus farraginis DSM 18382 = JCM 14108]GAF35304.1 muconate cycloisomerase [Lentilactobacillus farraginis DSM 18382 = JCM 14108]
MTPVIKKILVTEEAVPLKRPFKTALRTVTTAQTLIIKVIDSDGLVGFGEAAPTPVITGDTVSSIKEAINDIIGPKLIGKSLINSEDIKATIDQAMVHNSSPKAALNIAVNDLIAQHYHVPLVQVLGGNADHITTDYTVSVDSTEKMIRQAQDLIAAGFSTLKIKVGSQSERADVQRVAAIRQAVGPSVKLRLDANQGWHHKQAVAAINRMAQMGLAIELVEQPVPAADFEGLAYVTRHTQTMIMADESVFSVADAQRLISMRGCDLINLKLMKAGGIDNALKINTLAETAGISCMVGSMIESSVSVTAAAHLAAAKRNVKYVDLDASMMFSSNPVQGGLINQKARIQLPDVPGLGFQDRH